MLPKIAPRVLAEIPWEAPAAWEAVGIMGVDDVVDEATLEVEEGALDENVEGDVIDVVGAEVMEELTEEVGVAEVEVVDGGGVNPPHVHMPSVPNGI